MTSSTSAANASGVAPDEFVQRGWCVEKNKLFTLVDPDAFATAWYGKHRRKLTADLDQALVLVGACFEGSGINALDTLKNDFFKPHIALKALIEWLAHRGATLPIRTAAIRALSIYQQWDTARATPDQEKSRQLSFFFGEESA